MTVEKRGRSSKPAAERIGVLVLGMHRSGTSALARVLNLLGCDLPSTLMKPTDANEAGHWESVAIMNLNDQILQSAGSNWYDWLEFNPGWYSSPKAAEFKEKALAVLEGEYGSSRLFVLKDPRISRFAPFWLDVLEAAGVKPAIVTQVRNPLEVAGSLSRRDGFDPALGHLLWLRHVLDEEAGSRGHFRFHSSYDGLLEAWPRLVSKMQDVLNVSWPRLSPMTSGEIGSFLSERLRHHSESRDKVLDNPMLSGWLRDSYAIFSRWASDGESQADYATLDRIRSELNDAAPAFAQLILAGHQRAEDLKAAQQRIEEQGKKLEILVAEHSAMTEMGSSLESELKTARVQLEESQRALSEAQAAAAQSKAELDGARGELSQTQSALAQRSAEADEVTAQLDAAKKSLAEAEQARRNDAERAERLATELETERDRAAVLHEEIASITRMLQEREAELAAAHRRATGELEEERRRSSGELQKLRAEKGVAESRLAERFSEIAAMTRMLAEKEAAVKVSDEQAAWLRDVSAALLGPSSSQSLKARLASLMPAQIRLKKQKARLKRDGYFDAEAYLAAYPDVAEAGLDPLWHYLAHGLAEGRTLHTSSPVADRKDQQ